MTDFRIESFLNNLKQDEPVQYTTRRDFNLSLVVDDEPWDPDPRVREVVQNFDRINVELLNLNSNLNEVNRVLRDSRDVGLILLGTSIGRNNKPTLIILVCKERLYAIDPRDEKLIRFLKVKIEDQDIQFWTTNGIEESDCLFHSFGLNLIDFDELREDQDNMNVQCCTAMHIHLMNTISNLPSSARLNYPALAIDEARKKPRIEKFEKLVEIWLDISKSSIFYEQEKLSHLTCRPLNLTATNIILKRCVLVRPLIKVLKEACNIELRLMMKEVHGRLLINDGLSIINAMIEQKLQECKDKSLIDYGYYSYLEKSP